MRSSTGPSREEAQIYWLLLQDRKAFSNWSELPDALLLPIYGGPVLYNNKWHLSMLPLPWVLVTPISKYYPHFITP